MEEHVVLHCAVILQISAEVGLHPSTGFRTFSAVNGLWILRNLNFASFIQNSMNNNRELNKYYNYSKPLVQ